MIYSNSYLLHTLFIALPGAPRDVDARELPAGSCTIFVSWGSPLGSDRSDIDRYMVYVPAQNIQDIAFSTISVVDVPECRDRIANISVQAVNRFGCEGQNSSQIQPSLSEMPTAPSVNSQDDSKQKY